MLISITTCCSMQKKQIPECNTHEILVGLPTYLPFFSSTYPKMLKAFPKKRSLIKAQQRRKNVARIAWEEGRRILTWKEDYCVTFTKIVYKKDNNYTTGYNWIRQTHSNPWNIFLKNTHHTASCSKFQQLTITIHFTAVNLLLTTGIFLSNKLFLLFWVAVKITSSWMVLMAIN